MKARLVVVTSDDRGIDDLKALQARYPEGIAGIRIGKRGKGRRYTIDLFAHGKAAKKMERMLGELAADVATDPTCTFFSLEKLA